MIETEIGQFIEDLKSLRLSKEDIMSALDDPVIEQQSVTTRHERFVEMLRTWMDSEEDYLKQAGTEILESYKKAFNDRNFNSRDSA